MTHRQAIKAGPLSFNERVEMRKLAVGKLDSKKLVRLRGLALRAGLCGFVESSAETEDVLNPHLLPGDESAPLG